VTARSTGGKLIMLNALVSTIASGSAGFLNSLSMRGKEMDNGIEVFSDENLTKKVGISKVCAKKAVFETATSRVFLSFSCICTPAMMFYLCEKKHLYPKQPVAKIAFETTIFIFALLGSLPLSIAIFPQTGKLPV
jgi:hypothetical protein